MSGVQVSALPVVAVCCETSRDAEVFTHTSTLHYCYNNLLLKQLWLIPLHCIRGDFPHRWMEIPALTMLQLCCKGHLPPRMPFQYTHGSVNQDVSNSLQVLSAICVGSCLSVS